MIHASVGKSLNADLKAAQKEVKTTDLYLHPEVTAVAVAILL